MRYLQRRLERTPTWFLAAYMAIVDVLLCFGIMPFELYCRSLLSQHQLGTRILLLMLAVNAVLIAVLVSAMCASAALVARGAKRTALAVVPVLQRAPRRSR